MVYINKKGKAIAPLILLIGVVIVFYVLFLPPESREELLGPIDGGSYGGGSGSDIPVGNFLIRTSPGRLEKIDVREVRNALPAAVLFAGYEDTEIASIRAITVESSTFSEKTDRLSFSLDGGSDAKNVLLSFTARERKGRLVITLNGDVVFNGEVNSPTIAPILLPASSLKSDNLLEFRVSGPGAKFWATNEFLLENVRVTGELRNLRNLEAETSFIVLDDDLRNTETFSLRFVANCDPYNVGKLDVSVNGRQISSGIPVCGDYMVKEFTSLGITAGDNTITFKTDSGSYIVDNIEIVQHMKAPSYKTYYFEMEEHQIVPVLDRNDLVTNLYLSFADDKFRNLDVFVNGHVYHIDDNRDFAANIERFLYAGTNAIKLIPKSRDIDVVEMVVQIEQI